MVHSKQHKIYVFLYREFRNKVSSGKSAEVSGLGKGRGHSTVRSEVPACRMSTEHKMFCIIQCLAVTIFS